MASGSIASDRGATDNPAPLPQFRNMAGTFRRLTWEPPKTRKNLKMIGRSGRIRTCDPCVPNAVLYRTEPHSDLERGL